MTKKNIGKTKDEIILFKVIGTVILLFLIFFITGYFLKGCEYEEEEYNDFNFTKKNSVWVLDIVMNNQPYTIPFYYLPEEVEHINVSEGAINPILDIDKEKGVLAISINYNTPGFMGVAGTQISRITGSRYGILNIPTKGTHFSTPIVDDGNPVINCSHANKDLVVIHLRVGEENSIIRDGYCITFTAIDKDGAFQTADRFVYELLKIMG